MEVILVIGCRGERYRGTIKPFPCFNAEQDCEILNGAIRECGTDERAIIECLGRRNNAQRQEIRKIYKTMFGKDLVEDLKATLTGNFRKAVTESLYDTDYYDAFSLHEAIKGHGDRENVLTEILTSRTNDEIECIKYIYKENFCSNLEEDIVMVTHGFYKRVLVSSLQANKPELTSEQLKTLKEHGPCAIIDQGLAKTEAEELYNAGEKRLITDETTFIKVFCMRNKYQLRAIFDEYERISGKDIFDSIESEIYGDLKPALKAIAFQALNTPLYFAKLLHNAMEGCNINDTTLIRVLLTRSETDLESIKHEFHKVYGKQVKCFLDAITTGSYREFLLRFVDGN